MISPSRSCIVTTNTLGTIFKIAQHILQKSNNVTFGKISAETKVVKRLLHWKGTKCVREGFSSLLNLLSVCSKCDVRYLHFDSGHWQTKPILNLADRARNRFFASKIYSNQSEKAVTRLGLRGTSSLEIGMGRSNMTSDLSKRFAARKKIVTFALTFSRINLIPKATSVVHAPHSTNVKYIRHTRASKIVFHAVTSPSVMDVAHGPVVTLATTETFRLTKLRTCRAVTDGAAN